MKTITRALGVRQHNPPHPGEVLEALFLEPLGLTVTSLAGALDVSRKTVSKIVNGNGSITPEMALRLELAFGASAQSWLGHQAAFDLWQIERERGTLAKRVHRVEMKEAA